MLQYNKNNNNNLTNKLLCMPPPHLQLIAAALSNWAIIGRTRLEFNDCWVRSGEGEVLMLSLF